MAIQVYNTLTRQKEVFRPIKEGQVAFYVCGPTVYNYIHIGNARSAVAFDTIRRYFQYRGYQVNYVSNFTDVDDKIIKAAIAEGSTPKAIVEPVMGKSMASAGFRLGNLILMVRESKVLPAPVYINGIT